MKFWSEINEYLKRGEPLVLLYVVQSVGSSPGRQGFRMFVAADEFVGSIGGGAMEHKLVELAKSKLKKGRFPAFIRRQIHQSNIPKDKSGMICSGEQTVTFVYLDESDLGAIESICQGIGAFSISEQGIFFHDNVVYEQHHFNSKKWEYIESLNIQNTIYIVGGGHVGLALSKTLFDLDFRVIVLDNRQDLNTMENNQYASEKKVIDYSQIGSIIPEGNTTYVVLMSFGYKTDKECMQNLLCKQFKYFGVMGSQEKMNQLIRELKHEGFADNDLRKIYTPIGVKIHSKTPVEIAISIAAEIVGVKNKTFYQTKSIE